MKRIRSIRNIFALFILFASPSYASFVRATVTPGVESQVEEYLNAVWNVKKVGGSVLIARGGKILVSKGFGFANAELKIQNDPALRYRLGSLTKQFTAAAIMLLAEKGKLNVQDNACKYLDDCPEAWKPIIIHHLLTHTAGVPNFTALPDWRYKKTEDLSTVQVLDLVRTLPLKFAPGSDFEYSNTGYLMLGLIIEKASGKPYADFLKANIFEPLRMADSGYDDGKQGGKNFALGYSKKGSENVVADVINMKAPFSAGALYSTTSDVLRWSEALNSEKLLTKKSLDTIFTPDKRNYGYGWGIGHWNGRTMQSHAGGIDGFSSYIARIPADNSVVIVLLNNTAGLANIIGNDLLAILYGEKFEMPKERREISLKTEALDIYVGTYTIAPGVAFLIGKSVNGLTFLPPGQPRAVPMFAESEKTFFLKVVDATITFVKNSDGKVTGLEYNQAGRITRATKQE